MPGAPVVLQIEAPLARVTLARPALRNALDGDTVGALTEAVRVASARDDVRVLVIAGQGAAFCAGADLAWMGKLAGLSAEENVAEAGALAALYEAIDGSPKPVVARVHGAAMGGGAGLVAAADIVVAAAGAVFGFSEVRLGLVPAVISPYVIRKIGVSAARELFLTGERFPAAKAAAIGLVHHVVPPEALDAAVEARVGELLNAAPGAVASAKALIREVAGGRGADLGARTAAWIAERRASAEGREGLSAFLEKRKPDWAR